MFDTGGVKAFSRLFSVSFDCPRAPRRQRDLFVGDRCLWVPVGRLTRRRLALTELGDRVGGGSRQRYGLTCMAESTPAPGGGGMRCLCWVRSLTRHTVLDAGPSSGQPVPVRTIRLGAGRAAGLRAEDLESYDRGPGVKLWGLVVDNQPRQLSSWIKGGLVKHFEELPGRSTTAPRRSGAYMAQARGSGKRFLGTAAKSLKPRSSR